MVSIGGNGGAVQAICTPVGTAIGALSCFLAPHLPPLTSSNFSRRLSTGLVALYRWFSTRPASAQRCSVATPLCASSTLKNSSPRVPDLVRLHVVGELRLGLHHQQYER
jgi:hypothetical protein